MLTRFTEALKCNYRHDIDAVINRGTGDADMLIKAGFILKKHIKPAYWYIYEKNKYRNPVGEGNMVKVYDCGKILMNIGE